MNFRSNWARPANQHCPMALAAQKDWTMAAKVAAQMAAASDQKIPAAITIPDDPAQSPVSQSPMQLHRQSVASPLWKFWSICCSAFRLDSRNRNGLLDHLLGLLTAQMLKECQDPDYERKQQQQPNPITNPLFLSH
jgi:hypothetical protein